MCLSGQHLVRISPLLEGLGEAEGGGNAVTRSGGHEF